MALNFPISPVFGQAYALNQRIWLWDGAGWQKQTDVGSIDYPVSTLLMHFDGTNGATSSSDQYGHAITFHSTAQLSSTQAKFGPTSYQPNSGWISTPSASEFIYTGDFTIEFWAYFTANSAQGIYGKRVNNGTFNNILINETSSGQIQTLGSTDGSSWGLNITSSALSLNAWHHVALVRVGNTCTLYIDGTSAGTGTLIGTVHDSGDALVFGAGAADGSTAMTTGFLDEWRISPLARYTANFTVQAQPWMF